MTEKLEEMEHSVRESKMETERVKGRLEQTNKEKD